MRPRRAILTLFAASLLLLPYAAAQRIVSLAGEVTEIVYALGAEELLVAVDASSNYPEAANDLPNVGYHARLSAEALMAHEPTLVIANSEAGPQEVLDQLESAGVEIVYVGSDLSLETPIENIRLIAGRMYIVRGKV